jgi:hypothetical protein
MTLIAFATVVGAGTARAATINVSASAANEGIVTNGRCSLLEAIKAANTNLQVDTCTAGSPDNVATDTIQVPAASFTFQGALQFSSKVKVVGAGMNSTTIFGSSNSGPTLAGMTLDDCDGISAGVYVNTAGTVTFQNLTLRQTSGSTSAGICVVQGTLNVFGAKVTAFQNRGIFARPNGALLATTVYIGDPDATTSQSSIDGNHSFGSGAGVYADGGSSGILVTRSSITNNFSEGTGGAIFFSGGASLQLRSATVSSNTAALGGGLGLMMMNGGYTQLDNSTIASNRAFLTGGGIHAGGSGNIFMYTSIINNNIADQDAQQANFNTDYASSGGVTPECFLGTILFATGSEWPSPPFATSDGTCRYTSADAKLAPLAGVGGLNNLPVHALLPGSPALDASSPSGSLPPDQRGVARPQTSLVDIGAVEMGPYFETESMPATWSSNDTHVVVTSSSYHAGKGTNLIANAAGDFVTYQTPSLTAGTYNVVVGIKKGSNAGKFQLWKAETSGGSFTTVGGEQDTFASTSTWTLLNLNSVTISSTGAKFFKLAVTGKNTSSSGFQLFPDFLILTKQ